MKLHLDDNDLGTCVSCGLCLPHCPTFRVTGEEALSPRGRIAAMRAVHFDDAAITDDFVHFMETCVQCRGCEPACPSGVPFGQLMEGTRDTLAGAAPDDAVVAAPRLSGARPPSAAARRLHAAGRRPATAPGAEANGPAEAAGAPWPGRAADRRRRVAVHRLRHGRVAARRPIATPPRCSTRSVSRYRTPGAGGACCGALHVHAGLTDEAKSLGRNG